MDRDGSPSPAHHTSVFSAFDAAERIRRREVSSSELVAGCLARVAALDSTYHAYVTVLAKEATEAAHSADVAVRRGAPLGPLHGVPVSVKDAFVMAGTPTTIGMTALRHYFPPPPGDATCIERLRRAGAIIIGKTNVGSGVARADAAHARLSPACNPWAPDRSPGGSSGGSAAAVALGMGYASVGSDSGGSVRVPAALSGIVGLKPTYGRVSQYGDIYGLGRRLEHVGPLTRTVRDAGLLLDVLAGEDPKDATCVHLPPPQGVAAVDRGIEHTTVRIGWARRVEVEAEQDVLMRTEEAISTLARSGVHIEEIRFPELPRGVWSELVLVDEWEAYDAEATQQEPYHAYVRANLARMRQKMADELEIQRTRIEASYEQLFATFDLLALPTLPVTATPIGMWKTSLNGADWETVDLYTSNTCVFNITGHPAISVPSGLSREGLPVGLQLVGRKFEEELLLAVAAAYEQAVGGFPSPPAARG